MCAHAFAATGRARRELGFEAGVDLASGLRELAGARLRDPVDLAGRTDR